MEIILLGGYTNNRKGSFALFLDDWLTFKPNGQAIQIQAQAVGCPILAQ
jgi:hypothetical protein